MDEVKGVQVLRHRNGNGISVGFTGTRKGMTSFQALIVERLVTDLWEGSAIHAWHDGDCIGADKEAHAIVERLRRKSKLPKLVTIIGHPAVVHPKYAAGSKFDLAWPPRPPLDRNRDIVDASDVMIAAPNEYVELKRGSGTWYTIRYIRRKKVPLFIVWPNGKVTVEITEGL